MSPPIERVIKSVAARIYLFKSLLGFLGVEIDVALVPAVPIFVAIMGALPVGIIVVKNKA